jgi:hypothetical protein
MFRRLPLLIVFATLLSALSSATAQNFSLGGFVVDPSGAAVANAALRLQIGSGTLVSQITSAGNGSFRFPNVRPGDYVLTVPATSSFAERTLTVHLSKSVSDLRVVLTLASISQQVTVSTGQALSTEASENTDTVAVSSTELRKLPAVDLDYVAALSALLDASSVGSGGTTLVVDGIEMKSVAVAPSAIQEVRINNDPYSTEFNRPGRGRIEVTTKPGSQSYHGEGDFLYRDARFNAKNHFATTRPQDTRVMFEGHVTGPVSHARHTNFIASGEYRHRNPEVPINALGPNGPINETAIAPNHNSQATLRITHDFSDMHRLQVGYNFQNYAENNSGIGGLVLPEAGINTQSREDDLILNDRLILTPNLINQLLVTFEKDEDVTQSVTNAPTVQVSGAFTGGGAQADLARTENTIHVNEVVSWSHGPHYLRFGVQLPQFSRRAVDDRTNRLGTFSFASLADYAGNRPYVFTAQRGVGRGLYWINEFGSFLQDQMKLTPRLQLSFGVRYDWQTFVGDHNNFAPRISVAYAVSKTTVLRAGAGVFYDRTGGDFPANAVLHNGSILDTVQLQNPTYPLSANAGFPAVPSNLVRFAPGMRSPYTLQSSVGVEHQISKKAAVTATYRNAVQIKSFRSRDANAPVLPPNPSLTADYARPNPNLGQVQQIEADGRQIVNALDLTFRGDAGRWFSGQVQYTLSRAMNNTGGIRSFPQDQYDPNAEWGRANFDRLHSLNVLGNINPDHWLTLGVELTLNSGARYTETTGTDDFHTGLGNARPAGVARNTLVGGPTSQLDLQWNHDFRLTKAKDDKARYLSVGLAAFNVFNHTMYQNYIGTLTSPLFGQPTSAANGRQLQLTVGYRF